MGGEKKKKVQEETTRMHWESNNPKTRIRRKKHM